MRIGCDCRADCGGTHFFASETRNSYTDKSLADIDKYISQVTFLLSNNMIYQTSYYELHNDRFCLLLSKNYELVVPWNLYEVHEKLLVFIVLLNDA